MYVLGRIVALGLASILLSACGAQPATGCRPGPGALAGPALLEGESRGMIWEKCYPPN